MYLSPEKTSEFHAADLPDLPVGDVEDVQHAAASRFAPASRCSKEQGTVMRAALGEELQDVLGAEFGSLPPESIQKLIDWKLAPLPISAKSQTAHRSTQGLEPASVQVSKPAVTKAPDGDARNSQSGSILANISTAVQEPGSSDQPTCQTFRLEATSLTGELLAVLSCAHETWTRVDILRELLKQAPVQPPEYYKIMHGESVLTGARTLRDCGFTSSESVHSIQVVKLLNDQQPVLQQKFEAVLDIEDGAVRARSLVWLCPPGIVELTMRALCSLFGVPPVKNHAGADDYSKAALQTFLQNKAELVKRVKDIHAHVDKTPETTIAKLAPFVEDSSFAPDKIFSGSLCCGILCSWCHSL